MISGRVFVIPCLESLRHARKTFPMPRKSPCLHKGIAGMRRTETARSTGRVLCGSFFPPRSVWASAASRSSAATSGGIGEDSVPANHPIITDFFHFFHLFSIKVTFWHLKNAEKRVFSCNGHSFTRTGYPEPPDAPSPATPPAEKRNLQTWTTTSKSKWRFSAA